MSIMLQFFKKKTSPKVLLKRVSLTVPLHLPDWGPQGSQVQFFSLLLYLIGNVLRMQFFSLWILVSINPCFVGEAMVLPSLSIPPPIFPTEWNLNLWLDQQSWFAFIVLHYLFCCLYRQYTLFLFLYVSFYSS